MTTHGSELVAVEDMENLAIEGDVDTEIEVLPMPESAQFISRDPLPLYQLTLRNTTAVGEMLSTGDSSIHTGMDTIRTPLQWGRCLVQVIALYTQAWIL